MSKIYIFVVAVLFLLGCRTKLEEKEGSTIQFWAGLILGLSGIACLIWG